MLLTTYEHTYAAITCRHAADMPLREACFFMLQLSYAVPRHGYIITEAMSAAAAIHAYALSTLRDALLA